MFKKSNVIAAMFAIAANHFSGVPAAMAADHIDSPRVRGAEVAAVDITDLFVFRSPTDSSKIVLAMNFFTPVGAPESAQLFRSSEQADYAFYIDTDSDNEADQKIRVRFGAEAGNAQTFVVEGIPGSDSIEGLVTTAGETEKIATSSNASVFAGLRDDPFFFDFEGYNAFLSAPCIPTAGLRCPGTGSPTDFFLGLNVSSIVIEFPLEALPGLSSANAGSIGVWAKTFVK
jgi:hypothetical protein